MKLTHSEVNQCTQGHIPSLVAEAGLESESLIHILYCIHSGSQWGATDVQWEVGVEVSSSLLC